MYIKDIHIRICGLNQKIGKAGECSIMMFRMNHMVITKTKIFTQPSEDKCLEIIEQTAETQVEYIGLPLNISGKRSTQQVHFNYKTFFS